MYDKGNDKGIYRFVNPVTCIQYKGYAAMRAASVILVNIAFTESNTHDFAKMFDHLRIQGSKSVILYMQIFLHLRPGLRKQGMWAQTTPPSLYRSYLSIGKVYFHSVTCIMMPIKCLLRAENFNLIV